MSTYGVNFRVTLHSNSGRITCIAHDLSSRTSCRLLQPALSMPLCAAAFTAERIVGRGCGGRDVWVGDSRAPYPRRQEGGAAGWAFGVAVLPPPAATLQK